MNLKDKLPLLERIARYINPIQYTVTGSFGNPTRQEILRADADLLDQKEADYQELTNLIKQIESI